MMPKEENASFSDVHFMLRTTNDFVLDQWAAEKRCCTCIELFLKWRGQVPLLG